VNRKDQDKKRSGLAGLLLRFGIGSEAGGGVAGTEGFGGLLGAGVSGGLLATKAGIIGLILVGTTVAGSLGVVAYKLFGPTAADRPDASFTSLFSPKPQNAAGAVGHDASASANGVSKSLQYLADANAKGEAVPQDQTAQAASAPPANASASAAVAPPLKNDNVLGSTVAKLKSDHKFGAMSQGAASGSGGSVSLPAGGGAAGNAASLLAGKKGGNLSGMAASQPGMGSMSALRSRALGGGAVRQLGAVRHDQTGAASSQAAGRTYDGNAATPSPAASAGDSGTQNSGADTNPRVNPSGGSSADQFPSSVASVAGTNVTPWQAAINTAMILTMLSAGLLFAADKVAKMKITATFAIGAIQAWVCILAGLAAAVASAVIALGAEIGGGKYGQPLQGKMLCLAGGLLVACSGILMAGALSADAGKPGSDQANQLAMSGNVEMLMMLCGGAALAAMAWAYMAPKNTYSSGLFKDGRPPDWDHSYQSAQVGRLPSQGILDQYLA